MISEFITFKYSSKLVIKTLEICQPTTVKKHLTDSHFVLFEKGVRTPGGSLKRSKIFKLCLNFLVNTLLPDSAVTDR